jgi:hypothetical protein
MQPDSWIQLLLRLLPSLIVFGLGFYAATDKKTRERWGDLLYQVGSIRPDQREDPQIGKGVKWPFFVLALLLLIWPISYYRVATRVFEVKSDLYTQPRKNTVYEQAGNAVTNSASEATGNAVTNSATSSPPASSAPATASQPTNVYGQPR